jgi:hypothetical protein
MSLDPSIAESLRTLVGQLREIESLLDRLEPDLDATDALGQAVDSLDRLVSPEAVAWQEFVEEHPELTEAPRLEFTDEEVYDALVGIHKQEPWTRETIHAAPLEERVAFNFPDASGVRRLLLQRKDLFDQRIADRRLDHSDLMRVVAALKRLERAGRVVQEVRYVYGQRRSSDWHPSVAAISTDESA